MKQERTEILITGCGVSGSLLAGQLAGAGKQVLVLEAGPERRLDGLHSSQIHARSQKWRGSPVLDRGNDTVGFNFNAGSGTGGSGLHHYAVWPRMHEEDFHMYSDHGEGLDWPIGYGDLRPYYDLVQEEVGISGDADAERWRPPGTPYPMPPLPVFAQGRVIAGGFAKKGLHTAPIPLAINSVAYHGRPPCLFDGWCDAGCPIGALANPLVTWLAGARKAGATIRHRAIVRRLLTDNKGDKVTGVQYVSEDGRLHEVLADTVILAAYTIENPRLLLASANERHPQGLANRSGLVGKYLMTHPSCRISGLFAEETNCYLGATGGQLINQDFYAKEKQGNAFGSYQWLIATAVKPNDLLGIATTRADLFGDPLHRFMQDAARHFGTMVAVVEGLPVRENHVRLSSRKDRYGVPLAEIVHRIHPASRALWQHACEQGKAIFAAAGAREIWNGPVEPMHILGGTIMGDDPEHSVTNSFGRCHDLPNLFIAGAGLFPTSAGVNPTFTLSALARRTAEYILTL